MERRYTESLLMKSCGMPFHMMMGVVLLVLPNWVFAQGDQTYSKSSLESRETDMADGQRGIGEKYTVVPVRRGALVDEKGAALDQTVKNRQGEVLGTIQRLLKDKKTGKIEYAVLELRETKYQLPLQWNQFKREGGILMLNASKDELYPSTSSIYAKDMSPDISQYMDEINSVRNNQPKPKAQGGSGKRQDSGATNPGIGSAVGSDFGTEAGTGSTGSTGSSGSSGGAGYGAGTGSSGGTGSGGK